MYFGNKFVDTYLVMQSKLVVIKRYQILIYMLETVRKACMDLINYEK